MPARTEAPDLFERLRARYFRNWWDAFLSMACILIVALIALRFFQWAVLDAVWTAKSATDCTSRASGACWAVLPARWRLILFGVYPFEEQWRAALGSGVLLVASVLSCVPWFWRFTRIVALWLSSFVFFLLVMRGGFLGLLVVSSEYWGGLALTLFLFASIMVLGMPLATLLALARQSNIRWLRAAVGVFIDLTRAVPLIAIVFGASLIVPLILPGWLSGDKLFRVVLGFAAFFAAYQAELLRGGFQAIDKGQSEAAKALGMRYWQYQLTILIPQAFRITLPQTVNQAVAGFKDTSYIAIVGFFDMTASASAALGTGDWALAYLEVFFVVGALYFVFAYSLSRYGAYLERRMAVGQRR
jgi:general L-amino acid transport system permease protein